MENFVERCNFKVEDMISREYHPLALKVLGTRVGANPEDWQNIKIDFKYYENENKHHIFSILRSSHDALIPQYQRMFLDIALSGSSLSVAEWQMRCLYGENDKRFISDLHLKMFEVYGGCPQLTSVKVEGVVSLRCLYWDGILGEYPDLTSLESLEGFWLVNSEAKSPPPLQGSLDFSRSSNLDTLGLSYLPLCLLNLNQAVNLRSLNISDCRYLERFDGLEALVKLEVLLLLVCSSLLEFPSLVNFPSLIYLCLEGAAKLKEIHGFANSTALLKLSLKGGKELEELPGIEACTRLNELDLSETNLGVCSWISVMKELTLINLSGTEIRFVPECSELSKLSELRLKNCEALEILGSEKGIHQTLPRNVLVITAKYSRSLKVLPQFNYESALVYLNISGTSVEEISGVMNCKHLEELCCAETHITSLPDLSSSTSLKVLDVHVCVLLSRMDNIKSLPALEDLFVFDCRRLLALPELGSSKGLTTLSLIGCPLTDPNSVKLPTESTVHVEMGKAADKQSDSDFEGVDGENETLALMDSQEPLPALSLWRPATFFDLVRSWCAGLGPNRRRRLTFPRLDQDETERR